VENVLELKQVQLFSQIPGNQINGIFYDDRRLQKIMNIDMWCLGPL